MFSRRSIFMVAFASMALFSSVSKAADAVKYTQSGFDAAQKAGKSVLITVHADWCPTCKAQAPIIGELAMQPQYKDIQIMIVDFDGQKDVVKAFNARSQSTLIAFKGMVEKSRSVGETNKASIAKLLDSAI